MSVLSVAIQKQVEDKLVSDGLLSSQQLSDAQDKAHHNSTPLFSLLVSDGLVSQEQLTQAIATVTNVPYVNLLHAKVNPKVLELLPQDIAERYMAVPLGEMQNRLQIVTGKPTRHSPAG